jgi:hypothetical protein
MRLSIKALLLAFALVVNITQLQAQCPTCTQGYTPRYGYNGYGPPEDPLRPVIVVHIDPSANLAVDQIYDAIWQWNNALDSNGLRLPLQFRTTGEIGGVTPHITIIGVPTGGCDPAKPQLFVCMDDPWGSNTVIKLTAKNLDCCPTYSDIVGRIGHEFMHYLGGNDNSQCGLTPTIMGGSNQFGQRDVVVTTVAGQQVRLGTNTPQPIDVDRAVEAHYSPGNCSGNQLMSTEESVMTDYPGGGNDYWTGSQVEPVGGGYECDAWYRVYPVYYWNGDQYYHWYDRYEFSHYGNCWPVA